jgi:MFS family permease
MGEQPSLRSGLSAPFRDRNYRHLLRFLFFWGIALNLATPFFAVYMLQELGLSLATVIGFTTVGQASNILFLHVWGRFADQFGSKVVLSLSASLYLLVIFGWVFTGTPDPHALTIPLLVLLHVLAGIAVAGVTLTIGVLGMKLAPEGQGTSYIAAAGMAASLGTGIGPLLGGLFADFFSVRTFTLDIGWTDPSRSLDVTALNLTGFDFLFGVAFVLGILTINSLVALREEGEAGREVVQFPFGFLRRTRVPGVDVALGVTAYQVANAAKLATETAMHSQSTRARVARALGDDLSEVMAEAERKDLNVLDVVRHAARGTLHAVGEVAQDVGHLARIAMIGVMGASEHTQSDPEENLKAGGQGVRQGAVETGGDLGEVASRAIEAARDVARQIGLPEDLAATRAAQGILDAAEAAGPDAVARVKASLPKDLLRELLPSAEEEAESLEDQTF